VNVSRSQVGIYDRQILTSKGESYFSSVDDYANQLLVRREGTAKLYHFRDEVLCIEIEKFNYDKLKLFFLGLLWRAHVTNHIFFRKVSLGPHEKVIRKMILESNPGYSEDYSVCLGIYRDAPTYGLPIIEPNRVRDGEVNHYKFSLGSFVALIKVDKRPFGEDWSDFLLNPDNPLRYTVLDDMKKEPLYRYIGDRLKGRESS